MTLLKHAQISRGSDKVLSHCCSFYALFLRFLRFLARFVLLLSLVCSLEECVASVPVAVFIFSLHLFSRGTFLLVVGSSSTSLAVVDGYNKLGGFEVLKGV